MDTYDDTSGRHPVSTGHLVMGLAFSGLCAVWLAVQSGAVSTDDVSWLLPLPWVFAGAAGLIALALAGRRSGRRDETDAADDDPHADPYTHAEEIR